MNFEMASARTRLESLLEVNEATSGMYVRVHGKNLILGREETYAGQTARVDRVRLTKKSVSAYLLSHKRHNGRWEGLPFSGHLDELVEVLQGVVPHLVAPL